MPSPASLLCPCCKGRKWLLAPLPSCTPKGSELTGSIFSTSQRSFSVPLRLMTSRSILDKINT